MRGFMKYGFATTRETDRRAIEVGADEFARFFDGEVRESVTRALKKIGYAYVTLDLQGYRRGSANEVVAKLKED